MIGRDCSFVLFIAFSSKSARNALRSSEVESHRTLSIHKRLAPLCRCQVSWNVVPLFENLAVKSEASLSYCV